MTTLRQVVDALAGATEPVVLATVVRVVGSSYGGVGARLVVRVDGSTVGLVSGGCLESDLAEHARRVHASGRAALITYDTRADDDAIWGLGLGCNGLIEVLLAPLAPRAAQATAALLAAALGGDLPAVLATVVAAPDDAGAPRVGALALLGDAPRTVGDWGDGAALGAVAAHRDAARAAGRRGHVVACAGATLACEVVQPAVRLVVCGSGPDALPVVRAAVPLGWDVTVVDHRPATPEHAARFPGARLVPCDDPARLPAATALGPRTAVVVMSHHFARDAAYVQAALAARAGYVGVLGPRPRTERMLAELAARGAAPDADAAAHLYGPVGLDVGGDGPEAIALAVVAEASAVMHGRTGGHLRDRRAPLHDVARAAPVPDAV